MRLIKQWSRLILHSARLAIGFFIYLVINKTPAFSYQSMVALFCLSKGQSNDFLSRIINIFNKPQKISNATGILGDMSNETQRKSVVAALRERGCYVFREKLSPSICIKLLNYATTHPCINRSMDGHNAFISTKSVYQRNSSQSVRYDFETQDLLDNHEIQRIISDLSLVSVAQDYLGAKPKIDVISMWWHTAFSDKPDSLAAQYYHFDMDRPKWLKFFIYLTDVSPKNGPHTFVAGSHKTGGIPANLLRQGYVRLPDDEVEEQFQKEDIVEFSAPCGTIIAEDTRGLHKGKQVAQGDRLVLQIQYSNSLFGGYYPKACIGETMCEELRNSIKQYPNLYSAYLK